MAKVVTGLALPIPVHVWAQRALTVPHTVSAGIFTPVGITAEAGWGLMAWAGQTRPVTVWGKWRHNQLINPVIMKWDFCYICSCMTKTNFPTSAFVDSLVIVSVGGTLGQTLSIVTDGFRVATHIAVIKVRSITRGTISMAMHTLLLLLAGKVAIRTIIHTLILMEEVVKVTLWERDKRRVRTAKQCCCLKEKTLKWRPVAKMINSPTWTFPITVITNNESF